MKKVVVRFAPSPTGMLHIGGLRTALFNWLWARKHHGTFILRIEDTDQTRLVEGAAENIMEALRWYGLTYDQGPLYQSSRTAVYQKFAQQLLKQGKAYRCFCSPERLAEVRQLQQVNKQPTAYDGHCRSLANDEVGSRLAQKIPHVIRFKVEKKGKTTFTDAIYGRVVVNNVEIDDQILLKSDGYPTYHLANVIDDHEYGITHVIRGEEWLPSTPKHIMLYQALGWSLPVFAHLPMILGSDRSKLSKRHGAASALAYREQGYLSEAVINFIALLGWNPKTDQELFSRGELIAAFDLSKVNKSGAVFNQEKLDWLNGLLIRRMSKQEFARACAPFLRVPATDERVPEALALVQGRSRTLRQAVEDAAFIFAEKLSYNPKLLIPKLESEDTTIASLIKSIDFLKSLEESFFMVDKLKNKFEKFIAQSNLTNKIVLWPLRVALTGQAASPGVFEVMAVLGKRESIRRAEQALQALQKGE